MPLPPRISIVTPSYNQAQFLEECIDSILSQGYPNLEYVIMDGGSTDSSVEIIKRYEKYLTYWQSCPDGGQYAAINAGFAHTSGEIMAWLNSDDRYHPNAFLKVACTFSSNQEIEWITGIRTIWEASSDIQGLDKQTPYFSRRKFFSGGFGAPCIQQESTFWRRSLWNKAGGFVDTQYSLAADAELWLRFFRHTELFNVKTFLGGFRHYGDQRSILNMKQYVEELQSAIWKEYENLPPDTQFKPMPGSIYIAPDKYKNFAYTHGIELFNTANMSLWQNYLRSITNWIINRESGLGYASLLLDEIALWQDGSDTIKEFLTANLQQQVVLKNMAEDLIQEGELKFNKGDLNSALKATFEALDIWPSSAHGNNNLGVMLYHKGKIKEAIDYLTSATLFNNGQYETYRNLALIFYELGQQDKINWTREHYLLYYPDDIEMENFYRRLMEWR